ncbi:hypothetical protein CC80DRAFT_561632 [Byssothecium circinans]|uniref:Uncharacterized protein n=1 Tax=Byssothecium circinans TaxID=147558 RepID=A0A6A5TWX3_9PLEO|nr:hypothetical protein CC80DRAFT_561632 [Byssothecium circinans]
MANITFPPVIHASLNHLSDTDLWQVEKPYEIWMDEVPAGAERTNVSFDTIDNIPLTDIRQMGKQKPTVEKEGFEVFVHPFPDECSITNVDDVDKPEKRDAVSKYLKIMTGILSDRMAATKVLCYDWRVRRSEADNYVKVPRIYFMDLPEEAEVREHKIDVSHNIHGGDQSYGSPDGIKKQLTYLLNEDEKKQLASGKVRLWVVNLWRPINAVEPVEKIFENWIEESMYLKRNKNHHWYWISKQTRDEVTAFVCMLSTSAVLTLNQVSTPHSSVLLVPEWRGSTPRESIEMRNLVWTTI